MLFPTTILLVLGEEVDPFSERWLVFPRLDL
jgi:hypothetical protein